MGRRAGALIAPCLMILALTGCSDRDEGDDGGAATSGVPVCDPATAPPVADTDVVPDVGAVAAAVAAVEATAGGPQRYFEINADANVVNLFVATPAPPGGRSRALRYTYVGGALNPAATDLGEAEGGTFAGSALTFDPARLLSCARRVLPTASLARFVVVGDAGGATQYSIDAISDRGGALEVVVDRDGTVLSVAPA